jgi:hypothetical protein
VSSAAAAKTRTTRKRVIFMNILAGERQVEAMQYSLLSPACNLTAAFVSRRTSPDADRLLDRTRIDARTTF